jgi:hypothetical protein
MDAAERKYDREDDEYDLFESPEMFDRDSMRLLYRRQFLRFVDLKVLGIRGDVAFKQCFPRYAQMHDRMAARERLAYLEASDWFADVFAERLAAAKTHTLWNANKSVNRLLAIAEDPDASHTSKGAAIRELNVLVGITVVDEFGKTKQGRSLADFYAQAGNHTPPPSPTDEGSKAPALRLASSS